VLLEREARKFSSVEITCANIEAAGHLRSGNLLLLEGPACALGSLVRRASNREHRAEEFLGSPGHSCLVSCLCVSPPLRERYARPAPDMQRSGSGHRAAAQSRRVVRSITPRSVSEISCHADHTEQMAEAQFTDIVGQTLTKHPGSLAGCHPRPPTP